ncbi:unnamed protein product [Notodromas monacha]|uniref:G-protein coupled receptors family 1 profile domain-containing protein n=1 Tax=Notodromas monacha TaxID=399045 RepID=A0A7R9BLF1_9CRUS|nr:unnamed protein product [Notodromas monacha]CAG0916851.1 unnamed protein product [Notodromas monacha]
MNNSHETWFKTFENISISGNSASVPGNETSLDQDGNVQHWFYLLLSFTGLLIAIPNGLIVTLAIMVLKKRTVQGTQKAQYCYIASLAGSDMLVGLIICVIFMSRVEDSIVLCEVKISLTITSGLSSILHTLLIACDRYLYIIHGLTYRMKVRKAGIISATAIAWLTSALIGFTPLAIVLIRQDFSWHGRCYYVEVVPQAYAVFVELFYIVVGLVPTTGIYVVIVKTAIRQKNAVDMETRSTQLGTSAAHEVTPFRFDEEVVNGRTFPLKEMELSVRAKHNVRPLLGQPAMGLKKVRPTPQQTPSSGTITTPTTATKTTPTLAIIKHRRKITPLLPLMLKPLKPAQRFGAEKRAVTAILVLVLSFALAWLPHAFAVFAYHFGACGQSESCERRLAANITSVFFFVGTLNSLFNPFVYTWGFRELRKYVVNCLRCKPVLLRQMSSFRSSFGRPKMREPVTATPV